ncbi:ArsR/SmtB family transcription factor [Solimonas terrae]|uniref:Helix-turn-helix transcriptional regulator n=1 Tax=Solimonas terrae TaxID=1396819 RepID=A0A6M2BR88_9GAMM|nr:metalloregulator ArsR/SmtB family transcription factor [Solimonas terrae]NGY05152.1 helix-turn-helix transcriptional regulator [Solimonas terrae]
MKSKSAVEKLAALAQESRLAIFRALVQEGPAGLCAGDIGARLGVVPATLSFHLKELSRAGLLKSRQEGRFVYYAPDFKAMNALLGYLTENCCSGGVCDDACAPTAASAMKCKA